MEEVRILCTKGMATMYQALYYHRNTTTSAAFHPYLHYPIYFREFPEVNPAKLMDSAKDTLTLLPDLEACLNQLVNSPDFSKNLMSAAQLSKTATVEQLIKSIGIKEIPKISYNPDGITLNFDHKNKPPHCCYLSVQLRWR
ncbi:hypothetical protein [Niallia sp. RD1]|uniref:hypothetical protein n=1 Tax=Niallia sp. RD1 TaxID=2962858 RepID=UPI0020C19226|nr:hypothetical protein [Niallia sp. RD1]UTI42284.1 hypothetical protein NKG37_00510 [Niallia sp. RD1]